MRIVTKDNYVEFYDNDGSKIKDFSATSCDIKLQAGEVNKATFEVMAREIDIMIDEVNIKIDWGSSINLLTKNELIRLRNKANNLIGLGIKKENK